MKGIYPVVAMSAPNSPNADYKSNRNSLRVLGACVAMAAFFSSVVTVSGSFGYTMADLVKLLRPTLSPSGDMQPELDLKPPISSSNDISSIKPAPPPDIQPVSLPVPSAETTLPIKEEAAVAPVPTPPAQSAARYQFGDQVLDAEFENGGLTLTYSVVSSLMARNGVKEGSFYGHLKIDGLHVSGLVYGSTKKCGRVAVQVEGTAANDFSHIDFTGSGSYLDPETCQPVRKRFVQASLERI